MMMKEEKDTDEEEALAAGIEKEEEVESEDVEFVPDTTGMSLKEAFTNSLPVPEHRKKKTVLFGILQLLLFVVCVVFLSLKHWFVGGAALMAFVGLQMLYSINNKEEECEEGDKK